MRKGVAVFLLSLSCQIVASTNCNTGFTDSGSICYDLRYVYKASWEECSTYCAAAGAMMLCIQDSNQQSYVWSRSEHENVWLGAFKTGGSNNFNWVAGCASTYNNLASSEGSSNLEGYYVMAAEYGGQWGDVTGSSGAQCICQSNGVPTAQPSAPTFHPTRLPTPTQSTLPTGQPSGHPSSQPSSQPSTQPTVNLQHRLSILSSPTYQPRNGFAFAALTSTGRVETWGEAQYGGDSTAVRAKLEGNITSVAHARFAFVALRTDGSIAPWGNPSDIQGSTGYAGFPAMQCVACHHAACSMVESATGAVRAFGSPHHGGDITGAACPGCTVALASGVSYVVASAGAFVAVKTDGSAFVWGNLHYGGFAEREVRDALQSVTSVVATAAAFAALLRSGRVVAWGSRASGGDLTAVASQLHEVWHIRASRATFSAFKKDGGVVAWGDPVYADTSAVQAQLSAGVIYVAHTFVASAALKADGTVVTWGRADGGGDSSAVQAQLHDIVLVHGNGKAFAAQTSMGGVVTWGKAEYGGTIPAEKTNALSNGAVSIYHTDRAFAALKNDGSLVVWGQAGHGGSPDTAVEALLTSGVHTVCANDVAFSAIKTDGSVVAWGHSVSVPTAGVQFTAADMSTAVRC